GVTAEEREAGIVAGGELQVLPAAPVTRPRHDQRQAVALVAGDGQRPGAGDLGEGHAQLAGGVDGVGGVSALDLEREELARLTARRVTTGDQERLAAAVEVLLRRLVDGDDDARVVMVYLPGVHHARLAVGGVIRRAHPVTDEYHHQVHGAVLRGADVVVRVVEAVTVRVGDGADLARAGDDLDLPAAAAGDDLKVFKVHHVR